MDGSHLVLAMRDKLNVSQQNDLIVAGDLFKCSLEELFGTLLVSSKPLLVSAGNAAWRLPQSLAPTVRATKSAAPPGGTVTTSWI
jgi:hypothetical protein